MESTVACDSAVNYEGRMHMRITKTDNTTSSCESSPSLSICIGDFGALSLNACADEQLFNATQSFSLVDNGSNNSRDADASEDDFDCWPEEIGTPIVKNTFIECCTSARPVRRRKTLPASWRVGQEPRNMSCAAEKGTDRKLTIAGQFAEIIQGTSNTLEVSGLLESVETCCGPHGCVILLRPCSTNGTSAKEILALAQQSLRDAAAQSKVAYIIGYCSPNMAASSPLGFEITLGAMTHAKMACWHMFKKGECRHGARCRWQHPSCKFPVRVLVEVAELEAPSASIHEFKLQVAKVVKSITSALQWDQSVSHATACKNTTSEGWTIAVFPSCPSEANEEKLIDLAKTTVVGTTIGSRISLLGREAQPFVPRAKGFTIVLGNRTFARKPCANMYYWGVCKRGCYCAFEHPTCSVPIQVVTKTE